MTSGRRRGRKTETENRGPTDGEKKSLRRRPHSTTCTRVSAGFPSAKRVLGACRLVQHPVIRTLYEDVCVNVHVFVRCVFVANRKKGATGTSNPSNPTCRGFLLPGHCRKVVVVVVVVQKVCRTKSVDLAGGAWQEQISDKSSWKRS